MASAAWTRKAGKSPSGGLNAKGRASYKKVHLKHLQNLKQVRGVNLSVRAWAG